MPTLCLPLKDQAESPQNVMKRFITLQYTFQILFCTSSDGKDNANEIVVMLELFTHNYWL
jgi:hypothetical protein